MDAKSLSTLELPKVLERLASYAAFSASKDLARALEPTADLAEARRRQAETTEAARLLSLHTGLSIGGAHDVRPQAIQASRGAVLEPQELLDLKATLISARTLTRFFEKGAAGAPTLGAIAGGLQPTPGVIEAISQTLDERGEVLDSASPALQSIRVDLRLAHERLNTKLQRLITDPKLIPMLQEPIITQRDGRYVIPLRAEFKGRLRAIVHDQSASGATLFIEPLTVVDLNNQVRELMLAERDEVRRVLAAVSTLVGQHVTAIVETVDALARLDLAFAKARYALILRASEPLLRERRSTRPGHPGSILRLRHARHPLLDPARVVPIDLELDPDTFILVITGPNTGGKTVSLKTAGLLALMAQCGLHLPAESGSELTTFDAVYADIGDEQSIEQSLSTFSSHITTIIRVLERADESSLVVLDELGAGTDPQEGSALARAILGELIERRITTLVATHYSELKAYAHTTPGVPQRQHGIRPRDASADLPPDDRSAREVECPGDRAATGAGPRADRASASAGGAGGNPGRAAAGRDPSTSGMRRGPHAGRRSWRANCSRSSGKSWRRGWMGWRKNGARCCRRHAIKSRPRCGPCMTRSTLCAAGWPSPRNRCRPSRRSPRR